LDLLSNELLFCCAFVNLEAVGRKLILEVLLYDADIIHSGIQKIEIFHHLVPFGLVVLLAARHLIQQVFVCAEGFSGAVMSDTDKLEACSGEATGLALASPIACFT
jgi:hypothetical protein